jgi:hypothetical protein
MKVDLKSRRQNNQEAKGKRKFQDLIFFNKMFRKIKKKKVKLHPDKHLSQGRGVGEARREL